MTKSRGWSWALALLACAALTQAGCSSSNPPCTDDSGCRPGQVCDCGTCDVAPLCPDGAYACTQNESPGCSYLVCVFITTSENCGGCGYVCGAGTTCVTDGGTSACKAGAGT